MLALCKRILDDVEREYNRGKGDYQKQLQRRCRLKKVGTRDGGYRDEIHLRSGHIWSVVLHDISCGIFLHNFDLLRCRVLGVKGFYE